MYYFFSLHILKKKRSWCKTWEKSIQYRLFPNSWRSQISFFILSKAQAQCLALRSPIHCKHLPFWFDPRGQTKSMCIYFLEFTGFKTTFFYIALRQHIINKYFIFLTWWSQGSSSSRWHPRRQTPSTWSRCCWSRCRNQSQEWLQRTWTFSS